ncbi:ATP/GTP-binding protein [Acinetobacter sp. YH01020]|uniref:GTP-binding protein n=1 Tax=Acinetobacter sp. YH01020 TaxID=2601034 RepID=UPI0015D40CC0|nr:ATP/GTP-binding protein [Acinetobacter sp. YH01020]
MILQQYKIVFAGTMGAGKTTAIQSISDIPVLSTEALNTDQNAHQKMLTTVGIDYGELTLADGTKLGLYGTPGQERFNFIWNTICNGAIGTIIMIDHIHDHPIQQLNDYLNYFSENNENIIIAITHLDSTQYKSTKLYKEWQDSQQIHHPIFYIDARNKKDILFILEALIAKAEVQLSI